MNKPRVAASSYLNAAPLCYSFVHGLQRDRSEFLSDAAPARCSELLSSQQADAALIPVIEYARVPDLKIAPNACVASRHLVRSVIVASKVPLPEIRTLTLDTSSRTSAALIRILLEHFYSVHPIYSQTPPKIDEMLASNDAALIIGDPAMLVDRTSLRVYDLAEEWKKNTGLPFVFAFWAIRSGSIERLEQAGIDFVEAKREGIASIGTIAADYSRQLGLPVSDLISYLTENISYDLDAESLRGMNLYFQLAHQLGLIESTPDLRFLG
jgi:chorismate dehydratase